MGIYKTGKEKAGRALSTLTHPTIIARSALEKTLSITTPIATICTLGANPKAGILERSLLGPYQVGKTLINTVTAYAENQRIREFMNSGLGDLLELVGNTAQNLYEQPTESFIAAGLTFGLMKTAQLGVHLWKESSIDKYHSKGLLSE